MQQELTTSREAEILEECQKAIEYRFRKPKLLRAALTHASGADTRLASNEAERAEWTAIYERSLKHWRFVAR